MKVQSAVNPSKFYVRKIELGVAHVKLRDNIVEVTDDEDNIGYEFDEVEVEISDRGNLEDYISDNFISLFELGLVNEKKLKEPSDKEKIVELEKALIEMSNIQAMTDLAMMELSMMIGEGK